MIIARVKNGDGKQIMETLSYEVVSYIGRYLPWQDRKHCLETAKLFKLITMNQVNHQLVFNKNDIDTKLNRLPKTLAYIKTIKPSLKKFRFVFNDIKNFVPCHITDHWKKTIATALMDTRVEEVTLDCNHLDNLSMTSILYTFDCCVNVKTDVTAITTNEDWLYHPTINKITTIIDQGSFELMKHFKHVPVLHLVVANDTHNIIQLDLSCVDITLNKKLIVTLGDGCTHFVNIGKATTLNVGKGSSITRELVDCLKEDQKSQNCGVRIQEIIIDDMDDVACHLWIEFIELISPSLHWRINPSSPTCVWYMNELKKRGFTHIVYNCNSRQSWLAARLCKECFKEHPFEIVLSANFEEGYKVAGAVSVSDYFEAMDTVWQALWFPIYTTWKLSQQRSS